MLDAPYPLSALTPSFITEQASLKLFLGRTSHSPCLIGNFTPSTTHPSFFFNRQFCLAPLGFTQVTLARDRSHGSRVYSMFKAPYSDCLLRPNLKCFNQLHKYRNLPGLSHKKHTLSLRPAAQAQASVSHFPPLPGFFFTLPSRHFSFRLSSQQMVRNL